MASEPARSAMVRASALACQELVWRVLKARMVARQMKQETETGPPA